MTLQGSHRMGDGPIFLKTSTPHSFMTTYRINQLSAISIQLDSGQYLYMIWFLALRGRACSCFSENSIVQL
jgi:hypothetical protein